MNTARGPTRKKYLARTIQDFTTKVLNSLPIPKKFNRDAQFDPCSNGIRGTDGAIYNELPRHPSLEFSNIFLRWLFQKPALRADDTLGDIA